MRYGAGLPVIGEFAQGKLNDGGETLTLILDSGAVIQEIPYRDDAPWPESADGAGFSLTLADPGSIASPGEPSSWRASRSMGGSPGTLEEGDAPTSVIGSPITVTREVINAETFWILTIDQTLNGIPYQLEASENLTNWRSEDTGFVSLESNEGQERFRSIVPADDDTQRRVFVRLRLLE